MNAAHTPGPWVFSQGGSGDNPTWNIRIGSSLVNLPGVFDMKVMDANARLIEVAPDLLAALRRLEVAANTVSYCYDRRPVNFAAALRELREDADIARAVIARATGDQS